MEQKRKTVTGGSLIFACWLAFSFISTPLFSQEPESAQETMRQRFTEVWDYESWDDQCIDFSDAIDELGVREPSAETQDHVSSILKKLYDKRLDQYRDALAKKQEADVDYIIFALQAGQDSTFLTNVHISSVGDYLETVVIEQIIFGFTADDPYSDQLRKLRTVLSPAEDKEFSSVTQDAYFNKITSVFNNRAGESTKNIDLLISVLQRALTTTLLNSDQQIKVKEYLDLLLFEKQIREAIAVLGFDSQLSQLTSIQDENASKTFGVITQDIYGPSPKTIFDKRSGSSLDQIKTLISYLEVAQAHSLLTSAKQAEVRSMLEELAPEKAIIAALLLSEYTELFAALNGVLDSYGTTFVSLEAQNFFFEALKKLFEKRLKNSNSSLTALLDYVNKVLESTLLTDEQKDYIRNILLIQLRLDQIMSIADYDERMAALKAFLAEQADKDLDDATKQMIADALRKMFSDRPGDQEALIELMNLLNGLKDSDLISDDLKGEISGTMFPELNSEKEMFDIQGKLSSIEGLSGYQQQLSEMGDLVSELSGKDLDYKTKTLLSDLLQKFYDGRLKDDSEALVLLQSLLGGLQGSDLISSTLNDAIPGSMLPELNSEKDMLDIQGKLSLIEGLPGYQQQLSEMGDLVSELSGKDLDDKTKTLFSDLLQKSYDGRLKEDPEALALLQSLLGGLQGSDLISSDLNDAIPGSMLPTLGQEKMTVDLNNTLTGAIGLDDPTQLLTSLDDLKLEGLTLETSTQGLLDKALDKAFGDRLKDSDYLASLQDLLTGLKDLPALSTEQRAKIENEFLPLVLEDKDNQGILDKISGLSDLPDFDDRMGGLQNLVLVDLAGKDLQDDAKSLLDMTLSELYGARPTDDAGALGKLENVLGSLKDSDLISDSIKLSIDGTMLPTLTTEGVQLNIKNVLEMPTDMDANLSALQDAMSKLAGKDVDLTTQGLLGKLVDSTFEGRSKDLDGLNSLQSILTNLEDSSLLSLAKQGEITETLLPSLGKEKDGLVIQDKLTTIADLSDFSQKTSSLASFMQEQEDKDLDDATKAKLAGVLDLVYQGRPTDDLEGLKLLEGMLGLAQESALIPDSNKTSISGIMLPTIDKEAVNVQVQQALVLPGDADTNLDALQKIADKSGEILPDSSMQQLISQLIDKSVKEKPEDFDELERLKGLLESLEDSPLVSLAQQDQIKNVIIPSLKKDEDIKDLQNLIGLALAEETYLGKLEALQDIAGKDFDKEIVSLETQQLVSKALQNLYTARPLDPQVLSRLASVLDILKDSPLISLQLQQAIKTTLLTTTIQDRDKARSGVLDDFDQEDEVGLPGIQPTDLIKSGISMEDAIRTGIVSPVSTDMPGVTTKELVAGNGNAFQKALAFAMAQPTTLKKIVSVLSLLQKEGKKSYSTQIQNLYAQALQTLFDARYVVSTNQSEMKRKKKAKKRALRKKRRKAKVKKKKKKRKKKKKKKNKKLKKRKNKLKRKLKNKKKKRALKKKVRQARASLTAKDKITILQQLIALLTMSSYSTLLSDAQKSYVKNELLSVLQQELTQLSGSAVKIEQVGEIEDPTKQIDELQKVLRAVEDIDLDFASKEILTQAIEDLVDVTDLIDPIAFAKLGNIINQIVISDLIDPEQKQFILSSLIPAMGGIQPTQQLVQVISQMPLDKLLEALEGLLLGAQPPVDVATKNAIAQLLQELVGQFAEMTPSQMFKFQQLLSLAYKSAALSEGQQDYFKDTVLPSITVKPTEQVISKALAGKTLDDQLDVLNQVINNSKTTKPDKNAKNKIAKYLNNLINSWDKLTPEQQKEALDIIRNAVSKDSKILTKKQKKYFRDLLKKLTPKVTAQGVAQALEGKTLGQQIDILYDIVRGGRNVKPKKKARNTIAQAIQNLIDNWANLSDAEKEELRLLIEEAVRKDNKTLSKAQKKYFRKILKKITPASTAGEVKKATKGKKPNRKIKALKDIIKKGKSSKPDPEAQNAVAKELKDLIDNWDNLTKKQKKKAKKLIKQAIAKDNNSISDAQKDYFKKALALVTPKPTSKKIKKKLKDKKGAKKVEALKDIVDAGDVTKLDKKAKKEVAKGLKDILDNWDNLSDEEKEEAAEVIKKAVSKKNKSLTKKQKKKLKKALESKVEAPTAQEIEDAIAGKTTADKVDALKDIIKEGKFAKFDNEAKDAVAKSIQEVVNNWDDLSDEEKQAAKELIKQAIKKDNKSLSPKQKEYFEKVLREITPAPTADDVETATSGKTSSQKIKGLKKIIQDGVYSDVDADGQNAIAKELKDLIDNWDSLTKQEKKAALKLIKQAIKPGNTSLSAEQKKFFKDALKEITPKPTAGKVKKKIAGKKGGDKVKAIKDIIDDADAVEIDDAAKNEVAKGLQDIIKNWDNLSEEEREEARDTIKKATSKKNKSLTKEQKDYFKDILGKITPAQTAQTVAAAVIGKTTSQKVSAIKKIVQDGRVTSFDADAQNQVAKTLQDVVDNFDDLSDAEKEEALKVLRNAVKDKNKSISAEQKEYFKEILKKITPAPTAQIIATAVAGKTPAQQVAALNEIIKEGRYAELDSDAKNAVAQSLQTIVNNLANMSEDEQKAARRLIAKAVSEDNNSLSDEQKKYYKEVLEKITPKPTAQKVKDAVKGKAGSKKIKALKDIVKDAAFAEVDSQTQNAIAQELQKVVKNWDKLSEQEKEEAEAVIRKAIEEGNNSLSPEQKEFFKKALRTVKPAPTSKDVSSAVVGKTPAEQVKALRQIIKKGVNAEFDADTKNAVATALQDVVKNWETLTPKEKEKALEAIKDAVKSKNDSLTPEQKEYFKQVLKKLTPAPTDKSVIAATSGKSTSQQVAALADIIKDGKYSEPDSKAQNAIATTLQNVVDNFDTLTEKEKEKARNLIRKAIKKNNNSLSDEQKKYFAQVLKEITPAPTASKVKKAVKGKSAGKKVNALKQIIKDAGSAELDSDAKNEIAKNLQGVIKNWDKLSDKEKQDARSMIKKATSKNNNSLTDKQKDYLKQALSVVEPAPTGQAIRKATVGKTTANQLNVLDNIVDQGQTSTFDSDSQNALASSLQDIVNKWDTLTDDEKREARKVFRKVISDGNNSLTDKQKEYFKQILKTVTVAPTKASIQKAVAGKDTADQVAAIKDIIQDAQGSQPTAAAQAALAQTLKDIMNNWDDLSDDEKRDARKVIRDATQSGSNLVSGTDKELFKRFLKNVTPKPTVDLVARVREQETTQAKLDLLEDILLGAEGKEIDSATKNEYLKVLSELAAQSTTLSPELRERLKNILDKSAESSMLTPEQKTWVKNKLIKKVHAAPTKIGKQINEIDKMIKLYKGKPVDAATKKAFAETIKKLFIQLDKMDPETREKFEEVLRKAAKSDLLDAVNKQVVKRTMIPSVVKAEEDEEAAAQKPGAKKRKTFVDKAAELTAKINSLKGKKLTPAQQDELAKEIQKLHAKRPRDRKKLEELKKLLEAAQKAGVLAPAQVNYIANKMIPAVSKEIRTVYHILFEELQNLVMYARKGTLDVGQKQFGKKVRKVFKNRQRGKKYELMKLERLLFSIRNTSVVTERFKKRRLDKMILRARKDIDKADQFVANKRAAAFAKVAADKAAAKAAAAAKVAAKVKPVVVTPVTAVAKPVTSVVTPKVVAQVVVKPVAPVVVAPVVAVPVK